MRRARCPARAVLSLVLVAASAGAQEPSPPVTLDGKRAEAAHAWLLSRERGGFAGAVLIEQDGKVVLRGGYGLANRERNLHWTTATIGPIGSLTKQFTAAAIMDLWDRGLIAPSDSLRKVFPTLVSRETAQITIDQLLSHTSGLPE